MRDPEPGDYRIQPGNPEAVEELIDRDRGEAWQGASVAWEVVAEGEPSAMLLIVEAAGMRAQLARACEHIMAMARARGDIQRAAFAAHDALVLALAKARGES